MEKIKKNFGFGCMRLPMTGEDVDIPQFKKMVDTFIENGFNYFDTAKVYLSGKSETALKECLTSRYPRQSYFLTDKLSNSCFKSQAGIRPLIQTQLKTCGVKYFDLLLMHCQTKDIYAKYKKCKAYETAFDLKEEGLVRHVGFSFHDDPVLLEQILNEYPQVEVVQLQFNYLDFEDSAAQSKACYDVCVKHNKKVIVMEPVKGGKLINLPKEAQEEVDKLGLTNANLAIRFAASFDNNIMVLSGMSSLEQMNENISFMKDFKKLSDNEMKTASKVASIIKKQNHIECTGCRYCTDGCPKKIRIPDIFNCLNELKDFPASFSPAFYYDSVHTREGSKASDCIKCGQCEKECPQHLPIRDLLQEAANTFEKPHRVKH